MAKLVAEDRDGRVGDERRSGGTVECSREEWSQKRGGDLEDDACVDANREDASSPVMKCAPCWRLAPCELQQEGVA